MHRTASCVQHCLCSSFKSRRFMATPCGAEKPPQPPLAGITRWQGISSGTRFRAITLPTARAAPGCPTARANSPYVRVCPQGIARQAQSTRHWKRVQPSSSTGTSPKSVGSPLASRCKRAIHWSTPSGGSSRRSVWGGIALRAASASGWPMVSPVTAPLRVVIAMKPRAEENTRDRLIAFFSIQKRLRTYPTTACPPSPSLLQSTRIFKT